MKSEWLQICAIDWRFYTGTRYSGAGFLVNYEVI